MKAMKVVTKLLCEETIENGIPILVLIVLLRLEVDNSPDYLSPCQ